MVISSLSSRGHSQASGVYKPAGFKWPLFSPIPIAPPHGSTKFAGNDSDFFHSLRSEIKIPIYIMVSSEVTL